MSKKSTILLTGGTGFLGSKLAKSLLGHSYRVVVLKRSSSDLHRLQDLLDDPNLNLINIDQTEATSWFNFDQIDAVIHTATAYGRSREKSADIRLANLQFPTKLLKLAIKKQVPAFLNADTFFNLRIRFSGQERLYVKTKKKFLTNALLLIKKKEIKFINLKIEQMYGPDDNPTKFIPFIIKTLLQNKPSVALTCGKQKRDFIFIDDVARAFYSALLHLKTCNHYQEFAIGTGKTYAIREVVEVIKKITESSTILNWGALPYRQNELMISCADIKKNEKIHWQAKKSLTYGLKQTVDFYWKQF